MNSHWEMFAHYERMHFKRWLKQMKWKQPENEKMCACLGVCVCVWLQVVQVNHPVDEKKTIIIIIIVNNVSSFTRYKFDSHALFFFFCSVVFRIQHRLLPFKLSNHKPDSIFQSVSFVSFYSCWNHTPTLKKKCDLVVNKSSTS